MLADGSQLAESPHLIGEQSRWQQQSRFVAVPVGTRRVRFHLLGVRTNQSQANNDAYIDDCLPAVGRRPGAGSMGVGEQHIQPGDPNTCTAICWASRCHWMILRSIRTFQLFQAIWGDRENVSDSTELFP